MATFGYEAKGGNETQIATKAVKTLFACPGAGRLTTISVYLKYALAIGNVDVGIYDGTTLLGVKTVASYVGLDGWVDVDFSDLEIDLTAKTYGLGIKNKGYTKYYFAVGDTNQTQDDTGLIASANLPDPFDIDVYVNTQYS